MPKTECSIIDANAPDAMERAAHVLQSDGLVALPTETVYGLAGNIASSVAISRIYSVKKRPALHPLIVHVADASEIHRYGQELSALAMRCAEYCWPGPFTMLVPRSPAVPESVVGGGRSVALRIPANEFTRSVIRELGHAIAAPSANLFGRVSPTTALHVCADLGASVDLIVDDGPCPIGVESTIVDFTQTTPRLLRPGGLAVEDIESILGVQIETDTGPARAPGMLPNHYQPRAQVLLADDLSSAASEADVLRARGLRVRILDNVGHPVLYASTLYSQLRLADEQGCDVIVAPMPEERGLGRAIRDRLLRASSR